ncbi:MAG TPA: hypothetical protein VG754_12910 [Verrucomicrobiae bacterium]|nr:hypothetical protein [Verrucomicrobiae bacterium]
MPTVSLDVALAHFAWVKKAELPLDGGFLKGEFNVTDFESGKIKRRIA